MRNIDDAVARAAQQRDGIVRLDELTAEGIGRDALRGDARVGRVTRVHRGVFLVNSTSPASTRQRLVAAHVHLGPESTLILTSAAEVHGIAGVVGRHVPQAALPPGLEKRQRPRLDIHFWDIPDSQRTVVDGLPVTTVVRTLADVARMLPRMQSVACLDSALHLGLITRDDLPVIADLMRRKRQCVPGRRRLAECRPGAQSPLETRVRLRADDGGLPPDALQVPILSRSGAIAGYGDIGYRLPDGTWLIVEADGRSVHELPEALLNDRHRQNAFLSGADARILRFTWADAEQADYVPNVLRPPLERAGWRPQSPRP